MRKFLRILCWTYLWTLLAIPVGVVVYFLVIPNLYEIISILCFAILPIVLLVASVVVVLNYLENSK